MKVLAFFLAACSAYGDKPGRPDEPEAMRIAWVDAYGMGHEQPPHVDWRCDCRMQDETVCYVRLLDACVGGYYLELEHVAVVDNNLMIHETSFAHELFHAVLYRRTGDSDRTHSDVGWQGIVQDAYARLKEANL